MFAPPLYKVRKFTYRNIIDYDFCINLTKKEERLYLIQQQDNQLFRQVRKITNNYSKYNPYVIFVDAKGGKSNKENLSKLIIDGFHVNGKHFVLSERSASMTRTAILSFVDEEIENELNERISMGIDIGKTVLSKYVAYRGLMLSACHMFENFFPKVIVVPDHMKTIYNQRIKHLYDNTVTFIDKETGEERQWTSKDVTEDVIDYEINAFDGSGICHPAITEQIKEFLKLKERPTSIMLRMPFIKGLCFEMDYCKFYKERNVEYIYDIWGERHSSQEPMIILTESMYKGFKYFKKTGTIADWEDYWERFHKYEYCIGVSKWNFTHDEEPIFTRVNYQILQDLQLPYEKFARLAKDSIDWINKVIEGDSFYTYAFLGLTYDKKEPINPYMEAMLLNSDMIKEESVRKYLSSLFKKYINEMKCGKLWIRSTFKILAPDLIMLMEHIGKLEPVGCLEQDEFYTNNIHGNYSGEFLIERNPHLSHSEHVILNAVENDLINEYCSHLSNVCMINSKSLVPQRLNGADFDGDLVLVIDNDIMKSGVERNVPFVVDTEDKITALAEEYTKENLLALVLRTLNSMIGETSNCATCYWNKSPKSEEVKRKYLKYIDILSIINGKAILHKFVALYSDVWLKSR